MTPPGFYILKSIESLEQKIIAYQSRIKKQRYLYSHACDTSKKEIYNDVRNLIDSIKKSHDIDIPLEILVLGKDLIGSSIWILYSYLEYLKSFLQLSIANDHIDDRNHQQILRALQNNNSTPKTESTPKDIFQCIFKQLELESKNHGYTPPLKSPPIKATIVLISGVLNELYRTATFERGATYLHQRFGVKYYTPKIHGRKGPHHNARLLKKQLQQYIEKHPEEKLWILAHSKGGIDSLHFLRYNHEFASKHVIGISTIATPIMGSPHTNNFIVKLFQILIKLENTIIYQKIDRGKNFLLKNIPFYLSEHFQKKWFKKNAKYLPQNIFYSSLALESEWYKAHIWMLFAKFLFKNEHPNDGIVDIEQAHFPSSFKHTNLGTIKGHHLIGARSSTFNQEALLQAHVIALHHLGLLH